MNENINTLPEMLTVSDIMKHLKIGKNKAYKLIQVGSFPKIQIGNTYRIPKKEYEQWIKTNLKINQQIII